MIGFVKGTVDFIEENLVVIDCAGVGYNVNVPAGVTGTLGGTGTEAKLYTYMSVHEDNISLYGFLSRDDLNIFRELIKVSGIGPKGALGILSSMTADDIRFAVLSGDEKAFSRAPGVGKKTAGKIVLELKDKISMEDALEASFEKSVSKDSGSEVKGHEFEEIRSEAVQALQALGYSPSEALKAVRKCPVNEDTDVSRLIKESLKYM